MNEVSSIRGGRVANQTIEVIKTNEKKKCKLKNKLIDFIYYLTMLLTLNYMI